MSDNRNKNSNNDKNKKNFNGFLILLAWAVGLTVIFNYLSAMSRQNAVASTTHEILYSEFYDMVEEGKVQKVIFTSEGVLEITPVKGFRDTLLQ